tara:strand:- start:147 stop:1865 length:1719 start_codon:yes stop_codon:yes gene_type:complete
MSVRSDWIGAYPVFLLSLNWGGREYFISTKPVSLNSNEGDKTYKGGLVEEPDLMFDLGDMGFNVDAISTAISCILEGVDIAKEVLDGNILQDSKVELSYVLETKKSIQTYEERTILLTGLAKQPIFGHVAQPKGYVEFSIEAPAFFGSLYAFQTGSTARLIPEDISALTNTSISPFTSKFIGSSALIDVPDAHRGKMIPIVLGTGGKIVDQFGTAIRYSLTPAYVIAVNSTGQNQVWMAIASHYVEANQVRISDKEGRHIDPDVEHFIRADGSVFAYVTFDIKDGGFQDRITNINDDQAAEYFTSWNPTSGGGLLSRSSNTAIEGGGDICIQFLQLGAADIDYGEWESLRPVLNAYKFAGYINSSEISPLEFLENEIIPFLPISVIYGARGLKPVLNLLYEGSELYVKHVLTAGSEWYQNSPIQTLTNSENIVNYYTLGYGFSLAQNKFVASMRITPDINVNYNSNFSTMYSVLSAQRYGVKKDETESKYVHDDTTAALICRDKVRFEGVALRSIEYIASPRYGYIEVGDIILLTDSNLFSRSKKVQVIKKQWQSTNWLFVVKVEEHLQTEL